jgi:hypothetical protein
MGLCESADEKLSRHISAEIEHELQRAKKSVQPIKMLLLGWPFLFIKKYT